MTRGQAVGRGRITCSFSPAGLATSYFSFQNASPFPCSVLFFFVFSSSSISCQQALIIHSSADHVVGNYLQSERACARFANQLCVLAKEKTSEGGTVGAYNLWSSLRIVKEKQHLTTGWSDVSLGFFSAQAVSNVSWAGSKAMVPNSSQYRTIDSSVRIS
jgi:hypothetical protein